MRRMMTDQQYQALVARSGGGGAGSVSSQLLLNQSHSHNSGASPYVPRSIYHDRAPAAAAAAAEAYYPGAAAAVFPAGSRSDRYADDQDIRAQFAAAERRPLLPSPALVEYPPSAYADPHGRSRAAAIANAAPITPDVVHPHPGHYLSPQRASSDLLARTRRPPDLDAASYPSGYANGVRRIAPSPASVAAYDEPQGLYPSPVAAGVLGPGADAPRRGAELDRYLLAVQPEKLVRYAASCLTPDPVLHPGRYPVVGSNGYHDGGLADDDMYSNYRRAKAQRMERRDFRGGNPPRERRESYRENEQYRPREENRGRRGEPDRGKRPSDTKDNANKSKKGPAALGAAAKTSKDAKGGGPESGDAKGGEQCNGGPQSKRSRNAFTSGTESAKRGGDDGGNDEKQKENGEARESDSELGSLCADLSDSEQEIAKKKSEEKATVIDEPLAGMIFICSSATFLECMRRQLFGLPAKNKDSVMRLAPGTKVFLFNFDSKELSGIFEAVSHGGWQIQPEAFRDFGGFPSQVQVCCSEQCPNIPQSAFRPAIKNNYISPSRFKFDLTSKQVKDLIRLFRQAARARPHLPDNLPSPYINAHLSKEYIARGDQQQGLYSRQHQARFGKSRLSNARVISVSAKTNVRQSKASKRALTARKKTKLSVKAKSRKADNSVLHSQPGEIQTTSVAVSAGKCCGCCHAPNPNHAVIVREGVETGHARNDDRQKEIVETLCSNAAPKGMDSSGPDRCLSPSKPEKMPSNVGTQVSFVEDSYNDGNVRLAGCRADEQGQGEGPAVPHGTLSTCGDVIKSADSTNSALHGWLCTEGQGVNEYPHSIPRGDEVQPLTLGIKDDEQLSGVNEKSRQCSREPDMNSNDFSTYKLIVDAGGEISNAPLNTPEDKADFGLLQSRLQLVETTTDAADCELPHDRKAEASMEPVGSDEARCEVLCLQKQEELEETVEDKPGGEVLLLAEKHEGSVETVQHAEDCMLVHGEKLEAPVESVDVEADCMLVRGEKLEAPVESADDEADCKVLLVEKQEELVETVTDEAPSVRLEIQEAAEETAEDKAVGELLRVDKTGEFVDTVEQSAECELVHAGSELSVDAPGLNNESEFILIEAKSPDCEDPSAQEDEGNEERVQDEVEEIEEIEVVLGVVPVENREGTFDDTSDEHENDFLGGDAMDCQEGDPRDEEVATDLTCGDHEEDDVEEEILEGSINGDLCCTGKDDGKDEKYSVGTDDTTCDIMD